jgi:very-short-patch-repair endonuclease
MSTIRDPGAVAGTSARPGTRPEGEPPLRASPTVVRPGVPRIVAASDIPGAVLRDRVRSGSLVRVLRGLYTASPPSGPPWAADEYLLLARAAAVHASRRGACWFSHRTAAILWGCAVVATPAAVDVSSTTRRHGRTGTSERLVRDHWVGGAGAADVSDALALPVTSLERTVLDCATSLPGPHALVVADSGLRAGADPALLETMLASASGTRGVQGARVVLGRADARAESPGESLVRWWIAESGLPAPDLQVAVHTRLGWRWVDLGWPDLHLALEFDGRVKYGPDGASAARAVFEEKRRHDALQEEGWSVLRVTWQDLARPDELIARVARAVRRARRRVGAR